VNHIIANRKKSGNNLKAPRTPFITRNVFVVTRNASVVTHNAFVTTRNVFVSFYNVRAGNHKFMSGFPFGLVIAYNACMYFRDVRFVCQNACDIFFEI
jgi:hypothetical protein